MMPRASAMAYCVGQNKNYLDNHENTLILAAKTTSGTHNDHYLV